MNRDGIPLRNGNFAMGDDVLIEATLVGFARRDTVFPILKYGLQWCRYSNESPCQSWQGDECYLMISLNKAAMVSSCLSFKRFRSAISSLSLVGLLEFVSKKSLGLIPRYSQI